MSDWNLEFRRRLTWTLAKEHFRHGFVGSVVLEVSDNYDPTFSYDTGTEMHINITGRCPCGKTVIVASADTMESAELMRTITSDWIEDQMKDDTNPYVEYQTEGEVR